ncbi:MAG: cell division protein FtsZ [Clostridia bacterium]|jgi:hypothetical protein|nr:cell division protein FtsZ [Clostridia bacterium]
MKEEGKYDATYKFGNTIVHVVSPQDMTPEEIEQVLNEFHRAGWAIIEELVEKGEAV